MARARIARKGDRTLQVFGETVIIRQDPTGALAPLHCHGREDEICYVIEGTFRIWRGNEVLDVGPGGIALLPRHQVHTFRNIGTDPGRILTVIQPAGFERFLEVVAERCLGDDMHELTAIAGEFGLKIVGLPPS